MRLRNVLTVALMTIFGSMTLFGTVTYASDGLFNQQPIDAPPQVVHPPAPKVDEPRSLEVETLSQTPEEPTQPKPEADPASKQEIGQSISEPVVEIPKPADKPVEPRKKDSESGEKEETRLVTVSHPVEDQPAKQEIGKSNQAINSEPKESNVEVATSDNSQEQANASESSSDQEEKTDDQEPKTTSGEMEQTGSETVSLLLISIGVMGMGATLTVRYGWKGA